MFAQCPWNVLFLESTAYVQPVQVRMQCRESRVEMMDTKTRMYNVETKVKKLKSPAEKHDMAVNAPVLPIAEHGVALQCLCPLE